MSQEIAQIVVLDAGGQYCHLIARRVRELGVYTEVRPVSIVASELEGVKGVIISGGPRSVTEKDAPSMDRDVFELGIPVLGICYGHQLMAHMLGGKVHGGLVREYGVAHLRITSPNTIFSGLSLDEVVWMSHGDTVAKMPRDFDIMGSTIECSIAAMGDYDRNFYGLQFHPEVVHTSNGKRILENFTTNICKCVPDWDPKSNIQSLLGDIKQRAGDKNVFFLVSGGIDSTVAFKLCLDALGPEKVHGLYIDTGFMRENETEEIREVFEQRGIRNLHIITNKKNDFLVPLEGVYDPEDKRRIIGQRFLDVQASLLDELQLSGDEYMMGQGTIYPDRIESGGTQNAAVIKTHHNRVGSVHRLIEEGRVIEPLAEFYKDEVRQIGQSLGLPDHLVEKEPFPGPGLAIRCICSQLDGTVIEDKRVLPNSPDLCNVKAYVLPVETVGVQGDSRSYRRLVTLAGDLSFDVLGSISTSITNAMASINRVTYVVALREGVEFSQFRTAKAFVCESRLKVLREADSIVREFIKRHRGELPPIWQFPVILLPLGSVRGKESIALRPVHSQDGMTAEYAKIDQNLMQLLCEELMQIEAIDAVLYDITNKPPATIEWE